jgi:hypothetical protein
MKRFVRSIGVLATVVLLVPAPATAQGVTSAAVAGRVTDEAGAPVTTAQLTLVNGSTGQRYARMSAADGRFNFENVAVGGPYTLQTRALGFEAKHSDPFNLTLGQRLEVNVSIKRAAVGLEAVTVTGEASPLVSRARTGAQTFVSDSIIHRLPTLSRNFTDFIVTVPQVVSAGVPGTTLGGQNNRFNNIQIDGGVNNDLFGLAASGVPGGQANVHPISVEAVREYQVLIAPYDVRQGSFTGGLVNAVTKSGTNEFHGSAFGFLQNQGLVSKDTADNEAPDFTQSQYGGTFGGPIIRDRAHFFASVDVQHRETPSTAIPGSAQQIGSDTTGGKDSIGVGIRQVTAETVESILRNVYGFDPGTWRVRQIGNPDKNIFGKITAQLGTNSQLEASYNFVDANQDNLIRNSTATGFRDGYQLSNSGYNFRTTTNTAKAKWTSTLAGNNSNELLLGYQRIRDKRALPNAVPLIFVGGDRGGTSIAAGADRFSQANSLDQDIYEVTDNFTFSKGSHVLTVGTHNEFFHFFNVFFPASLGVWSFADTAALRAGTPNRYERAITLRPEGPNADFSVRQFGFYAQDQFTARPGLTITAGLRADIPSMDKPTVNPALESSVLNVNTGAFPSGNILWSPRLGFNYDLSGDQSTLLRGGIGIFSGRPPYVWVSNAFGNTGLEQATLTCSTAGTIPAFNLDSMYSQCAGGGAATQPTPSIVYFDKVFKFPQNLKIALGVDHRLPWEMVGTFDFLYTKSINQFYISDVNLQGIIGDWGGEGGRPLYGSVSAGTGTAGSATATPTRRTPTSGAGSFRDVLRHENRSADRSFSFTAQVQKRFSHNLEFNAGYTYSHTEDLFSLTSSIASSNYRFTALDGTIANRNLRTSAFDIPHKITASGTMNMKWGLQLSLIYIGQSGGPYTYVVSNDINGDGFGGNDPVYVPRSRTDISMDGNGSANSQGGFGTPAGQDSAFATLDNYINTEDCLREHRGTLLPRNTCRNPWMNFLNARLAKVFNTVRGQSIEVSADVFNVLRLIGSDWGWIKSTTGFEEVNLLTRTGFDAANGRGIYALSLPQRAKVNQDLSRWKLQLGVKYMF